MPPEWRLTALTTNAMQADSTPTPSYGGTLVATTDGDIEEFDPAISWAWANCNTLPNVFEGLLGYKPQSTELVPLLAADMPTVSEDGAVYTFTLRQGVKFQAPVNREVTADDVKYSWMRVLNPETASPGASFLFDIVGAQEYYEGRPRMFRASEVLDPYSLQIELVAPKAYFQYIFAMTFAMVVPREIVDQYPQDFSHHAVGTGPFMLKSWVRDQYVEFVRNPDYWREDLPYLDGVTLKVVTQPTVAVQQIQRGEADVFTDSGHSSARLSATAERPTLAKQLVSIPTLRTAYLWMNTAVSPLDNELVRQAIAMAIDKEKHRRRGHGRPGATDGWHLPTGHACYDPDLETWPYDPARAREVLARQVIPMASAPRS